METAATVKVGKLTVKGREFTFEAPASFSFEIPQAATVHVELDYQFDEASVLKEECQIILSVETGHDGIRVEKASIKDKPLTGLHTTGTIRVPIHLPVQGRVEGTVQAEAFYRKKGWLLGTKMATSMFRREERLTITQRTQVTARKA